MRYKEYRKEFNLEKQKRMFNAFYENKSTKN